MLDKFRLIDLSVPLEHNAASDPMAAKIHYVRHENEGLQQMRRFFGVQTEDLVLSGGLGWASRLPRWDLDLRTSLAMEVNRFTAPPISGNGAERVGCRCVRQGRAGSGKGLEHYRAAAGRATELRGPDEDRL